METKTQRELGLYCPCPHDGVEVNRRVWFRDLHGLRAVFVDTTPFYLFERNDEVDYRFCAVQLVEAELASASEICNAFGIARRSFSRIRRLVRKGGIGALVKEPKAAQGRDEKTQQNTPAIVRLYQDEGHSTYQIAALLGISPRTVGRVLKDEGIGRRGYHGKSNQPLLADSQPDREVTDSETVLDAGDVETPVAAVDESREDEEAKHDLPQKTIRQTFAVEVADQEVGDQEVADQELKDGIRDSSKCIPSASHTSATVGASVAVDEVRDAAPIGSSFDTLATPVQATSIPYASPLDRACLKFGLIDEAPVQFESAESVSGAGALLGRALLEENGLLKEARGVYGSLRNCWYGLRPLIWTLLLMAWLRIKKPEQIKSRDPAGLGSLLGLPRTPEVKTIRRKLEEISDRGQAAEFHRRMAQLRAKQHEDELFRLYIDGHVRVYYGQRRIGKTHVTRLNSWERGETDYWVHDSRGEPLLVVRDAANEAFTKVIREQVLPEIRRVIGALRVRVVFDRVGWCKELFQELLSAGFDFMTYRCQPYEPLEESLLQPVTYRLGSEEVVYELAESKFSEEGWPPLRLIAVRRKDGGQTHIVASGRETWQSLEKESSAEEPSAEELAFGMFGRWSQENWFKYMMEEYDLDVLLEYTSEPDDADREVPNPAWRKRDKEVASFRGSLRKAAYALHRLREQAAAATSATSDGKQAESCGACGRCLNCRLSAGEQQVAALESQYALSLQRRRKTPQHIRLGDVSDRARGETKLREQTL